MTEVHKAPYRVGAVFAASFTLMLILAYGFGVPFRLAALPVMILVPAVALFSILKMLGEPVSEEDMQ